MWDGFLSKMTQETAIAWVGIASVFYMGLINAWAAWKDVKRTQMKLDHEAVKEDLSAQLAEALTEGESKAVTIKQQAGQISSLRATLEKQQAAYASLLERVGGSSG